MSETTPSRSSGPTHHHRVEDGFKRIESAIESLNEPLRHAKEQLEVASREWRLLTPHHHLFTYAREVEYLNTEWKHYRQACEAMEDRCGGRSKWRSSHKSESSRSDSDQLERLRAQLAAVEVRLRVLESQRKASGVVDVLPTDVEFAGTNLQTAQEWLTTLEDEYNDLRSIMDQLAPDKAA